MASIIQTLKTLATLLSIAGLGLAAAPAAEPPATETTGGEDTHAAPAAVRGVNPADNLTKFELLPKFSMVDSDNEVSVSTLTLKYDRAMMGKYGVNVELPISYFDSPIRHDFGVSDLNVRGRVQFRHGRWTAIAGLETVFPIASADTLGSGKHQLNPTLVGVYAFSSQTFAAGIAKHAFSIAGDQDRDDIVRGQYRLLAAHTLKSGWWILVDPQLWVDYHHDGRLQFSCDGELGKMVGKRTGLWIHGGSRIAGDWHKEDWNISAGARFIFF